MGVSLPRPWPVRAPIAFGLGLTAVYAVRALGLGSRGPGDAFAAGAYYVCGIIGLIVCAWRAVAVRDERAVWALIALAFLLLFAGNTLYVVLYGAVTAPVPSVADVSWLAVYVPLAAALGLRVHAAGGVRGVVVLDVLIAISALGSITAASRQRRW